MSFAFRKMCLQRFSVAILFWQSIDVFSKRIISSRFAGSKGKGGALEQRVTKLSMYNPSCSLEIRQKSINQFVPNHLHLSEFRRRCSLTRRWVFHIESQPCKLAARTNSIHEFWPAEYRRRCEMRTENMLHSFEIDFYGSITKRTWFSFDFMFVTSVSIRRWNKLIFRNAMKFRRTFFASFNLQLVNFVFEDCRRQRQRQR